MAGGGGSGANGECQELLSSPCATFSTGGKTFDSGEGYGCQVCIGPGFSPNCDKEPVEIEWVYREASPEGICCEATFQCTFGGEETTPRLPGFCTTTCHPPQGGVGDDDDPDGPEDDDGDKCGPDITLALKVTIRNMYQAYANAGFWRRLNLCRVLLGPQAINSVDIQNIFGPAVSGANCPRGLECKNTVQVDKQCHEGPAVNYIQLGVAYHLCQWLTHLGRDFVGDFLVTPYCLGAHDSWLCKAALLWFNAGWDGWPVSAATPHDFKPEYTDCDEQVPVSGFTVTWDGITILPDGTVFPPERRRPRPLRTRPVRHRSYQGGL